MLLLSGRHIRRPESLKIDVSKYKAVESDSLLRCFVELDDAIEARCIDDDAMKVKFAMSNLDQHVVKRLASLELVELRWYINHKCRILIGPKDEHDS